MNRLKTDTDYATETVNYISAAITRKMKLLGRWLWAGILAMIVSIIGFYEDLPKIGNIALVVMIFSLFMLMFVWANINLLETTRNIEITRRANDRDEEA
jgi:hypothetical protein